MTAPGTPLIEIVGWILLGALAIVFVIQSRTLRGFTRPGLSVPEAWPALSVVLTPTEQAETRRLVAELVTGDYPGELEILLAADSAERANALETLTIASSRARVVHGWTWDDRPMEAVSRSARGEWLLVLPASFHLEPGAISRLVSGQIAEQGDVAVLLPRLEIPLTRMLSDPIVPWLRLTLAPLLSQPLSYDGSCAVLVRKECAETSHARSTPRYVDGFDSATRGALDRESYRHAISQATGQTGLRRFVAAITLTVLFALPLPVAIVTKSFPWIIGAVVAYWLRFRVAVRTGESVPAAFLHPLVTLVLAADLIRPSGSRARNSGGANT